MKKELYKGVEYHYPEKYSNAEEYLAALNIPNMSIATTNEIEWDEIRIKRDRLISLTDWTQTLDCPLSDEKKAEFVTYRQALRDIPQSGDDPGAVVWPDKPAF